MGFADSTAEQIIRAFQDSFAECVAAIHQQYLWAHRDSPITPMTLRSAVGTAGARSGVLDGVGNFKMHGSGCRVEMDTGQVIDFDWDPEGNESFDSWRLLTFARSVGAEQVTQPQLESAARASRDLTETERGWFVLRLLDPSGR